MTDRERWALRGPVHSCRLERTWYSRRCGADTCETEERGDITKLEFRSDGALARRWYHNPDGSEWTATHEYDDAGQLTMVRTENVGGVADLRVHEYDAAGRLVRVLAQRHGEADREVEGYEYSDMGTRKKTIYVDMLAQRPDTHYAWGVEGTDSAYSAPGASKLTILYNERDQPTELLFHDMAGQQLSRVEFRYDETGHLIEEAQINAEKVLPPEMLESLNQPQLETLRALFGAGAEPIRRTHRYDEQGRITGTLSHIGPLGRDSKTIAYNKHGDTIQEICEHEERDYGIDEEGRLSDSPTRESVSCSEARFYYDYDSHGNWVSKRVESRGNTKNDFILSSSEQRAITYLE